MDNEQLSLKVYKIVSSQLFMIFLAVMGGLFFTLDLNFETHWYLLSIYFFGLVISFELAFCRDLVVTTPPFMMMCMSLLALYGATVYDFLWTIPLVPFVLFGIIRHFIVFKPTSKFTLGLQFFALVGISIALLLGGLFSIKAKDYFSFNTAYYVLGLGVGICLCYLLFRNYITYKFGYHPFMTLARGMLGVGTLGFIMILSPILSMIITHEVYVIQWQNNLSTFMFLALPFPFYFAVKTKYKIPFFWLGVLFYGIMFFTFSRGGMIFGGVSFLVCAIVCICHSDSKHKVAFIQILIALAMIAFTCLLYDKRVLLWLWNSLKVQEGEGRLDLYTEAMLNFLKNPFFGAGISFKGDYYFPQDGIMYWYHSTPFQVIGSMGIVGIAAYTYQFFVRMEIVLIPKRLESLVLFLSFFGFQLMALVNPGDFIPLPYVLLLTEILTIAEISRNKPTAMLCFRTAHKKLY